MMHKHIPASLKNDILPFNWDVQKVWHLEAPLVWMDIAELTYLLKLPLWSSVPHQGLLFDVSPMDVIRTPSTCIHQSKRVQGAQLRYPIDMLQFQEKLWILDGVHRIAKHVIEGSARIQVRIHDESIIPIIRVS